MNSQQVVQGIVVLFRLTCSDRSTQRHQLNMAILQTTLGRRIAFIQQICLDQSAHCFSFFAPWLLGVARRRCCRFDCRHVVEWENVTMRQGWSSPGMGIRAFLNVSLAAPLDIPYGASSLEGACDKLTEAKNAKESGVDTRYGCHFILRIFLSRTQKMFDGSHGRPSGKYTLQTEDIRRRVVELSSPPPRLTLTIQYTDPLVSITDKQLKDKAHTPCIIPD